MTGAVMKDIDTELVGALLHLVRVAIGGWPSTFRLCLVVVVCAVVFAVVRRTH